MTPRILIADDHPIITVGLKNLLIENGHKIASVCDNGRSAFNFIVKHKPEIAILDIDMPLLSGIEIAKLCEKNKLHTKVVLLTLHKEISYYLEAKKLNVKGYLLKEFALEEINSCIEAVKSNKTYFSEKLKDFIGFTNENHGVLSELTPKERRILKLISQFKSNQEIGQILFISPRTVEKYRTNIILKLNLERSTGVLNLWVQKNKHLFD